MADAQIVKEGQNLRPGEALEEAVGRLLAERGLTVAVAESCTGGLIAHRLTNVPGSSAYFLGGVVAYANEVKERVLGVRPETLRRYGAVSRETALEMARRVRRLLGADIALSATGIAGPAGGTPEKPVGLVYVALAAEDCERCERHLWPSESGAGGHGGCPPNHSPTPSVDLTMRGKRRRLLNKWQTAEAALQMLLEYLEAKA